MHADVVPAHEAQSRHLQIDLHCSLICRYINTSAITVDENFSAERTYILLRTLGLRHVTVVDKCVAAMAGAAVKTAF